MVIVAATVSDLCCCIAGDCLLQPLGGPGGRRGSSRGRWGSCPGVNFWSEQPWIDTTDLCHAPWTSTELLIYSCLICWTSCWVEKCARLTCCVHVSQTLAGSSAKQRCQDQISNSLFAQSDLIEWLTNNGQLETFHVGKSRRVSSVQRRATTHEGSSLTRMKK
jgi:hypothetical protein